MTSRGTVFWSLRTETRPLPVVSLPVVLFAPAAGEVAVAALFASTGLIAVSSPRGLCFELALGLVLQQQRHMRTATAVPVVPFAPVTGEVAVATLFASMFCLQFPYKGGCVWGLLQGSFRSDEGTCGLQRFCSLLDAL